MVVPPPAHFNSERNLLTLNPSCRHLHVLPEQLGFTPLLSVVRFVVCVVLWGGQGNQAMDEGCRNLRFARRLHPLPTAVGNLFP